MGSFVLSATSAACFAGGGLLMKPSAGFSRIWPSLAVGVLFVSGTVLLAVTVNAKGEVGPSYLIIGALETVLVFALGVLLFDDQLSGVRLVAVALVLAGTVLLAHSG